MGVEGDGFAEFIGARQLALQRTAWWLTGDWALAEDLVQAALVRPGTPPQPRDVRGLPGGHESLM